MMYPHRIRLRGPWQVEPVAQIVRHADGRTEVLDEPVPAPRRVTVPCRWQETGLENFTGRARFRRRFGYPGQIDSHERVWLTLARVSGLAEIWLNGEHLAAHSGAPPGKEFEITKLLQVRNELVVQVDVSEKEEGLCGEVALEVRCTAFLRGIRAYVLNGPEGSSLLVAGEVVGSSERPLELYVLLDGATCHYATVEPAVEGTPFRVQIPGPDSETPGGHVLRVDLVNGASLWYVVEHVVRFMDL